MNYQIAFWAAAAIAAAAVAIAIQQGMAKKKQAEQYAAEKQTLQQIISRLQYGAAPEVGGQGVGENYPIYSPQPNAGQIIDSRTGTTYAPMYVTK